MPPTACNWARPYRSAVHFLDSFHHLEAQAAAALVAVHCAIFNGGEKIVIKQVRWNRTDIFVNDAQVSRTHKVDNIVGSIRIKNVQEIFCGR